MYCKKLQKEAENPRTKVDVYQTEQRGIGVGIREEGCHDTR